MRLLLVAIALVLFSHSVSSAKDTDELIGEREFTKSFHAEYTLERVIDGDTIVADGIKIRLWGIDAPEKKSDFYLPSKLLLESILSEGILRCKFIEKDRYQSYIMHCLIDDLDVGSMMVQVGMAKDYSKYSGDFYQYEEDQARAKRLGMWKDKANK